MLVIPFHWGLSDTNSKHFSPLIFHPFQKKKKNRYAAMKVNLQHKSSLVVFLMKKKKKKKIRTRCSRKKAIVLLYVFTNNKSEINYVWFYYLYYLFLEAKRQLNYPTKRYLTYLYLRMFYISFRTYKGHRHGCLFAFVLNGWLLFCVACHCAVNNKKILKAILKLVSSKWIYRFNRCLSRDAFTQSNICTA